MTRVRVQRHADAPTANEYGCLFRRILPWEHPGPSDNGMGLALIPPSSASQPHAHDEHEHFVVCRGHGRVVVDGASAPVHYGDAVLVAPRQRHHFENASDTESLEILCLWTGEPLGVGSQ